MTEFPPRYLLSKMFNPPYRQTKEVAVSTEEEQQRILFGELFTAIQRQGKQTLRSGPRRELQGKQCAVNQPLLNDQGEFKHLITANFTIAEGTIMSWRGMPTAVAYGKINGSNNFMLIGEAHYSETLLDNGIDPKTTTRTSGLLGEFPGHFLQSIDALAFVVAPLGDTKNMGIITGDALPNSREGIIIPTESLTDKDKKRQSLQQITEFIGDKISKKFGNT